MQVDLKTLNDCQNRLAEISAEIEIAKANLLKKVISSINIDLEKTPFFVFHEHVNPEKLLIVDYQISINNLLKIRITFYVEKLTKKGKRTDKRSSICCMLDTEEQINKTIKHLKS